MRLVVRAAGTTSGLGLGSRWCFDAFLPSNGSARAKGGESMTIETLEGPIVPASSVYKGA
jgi:hypothetical protein